jgi:hypothetical protein
MQQNAAAALRIIKKTGPVWPTLRIPKRISKAKWHGDPDHSFSQLFVTFSNQNAPTGLNGFSANALRARGCVFGGVSAVLTLGFSIPFSAPRATGIKNLSR